MLFEVRRDHENDVVNLLSWNNNNNNKNHHSSRIMKRIMTITRTILLWKERRTIRSYCCTCACTTCCCCCLRNKLDNRRIRTATKQPYDPQFFMNIVIVIVRLWKMLLHIVVCFYCIFSLYHDGCNGNNGGTKTIFVTATAVGSNAAAVVGRRRWSGSSSIHNTNHKSRFITSGPVITITVKDPLQIIDYENNARMSEDDENNTNKPWIDLSSIRPNVQWNIQSNGSPLPNWLPILKSLHTKIGYQYNDQHYHDHDEYDEHPMMKKRTKNRIRHFIRPYIPSWIETNIKLSLPGYSSYGNELQIQPTYETKHQNTHVCIQANHKSSYLVAQLHHMKQKQSRDPMSTTTNRNDMNQQQSLPYQNNMNSHKWFLELIRGSWIWYVPSAAIASIRLTPTFNFRTKDVQCTMEMKTGGIGKTKAIVHLEYQEPKIMIHYQMNDRTIIRPEISLYDANIIYHWTVLLGPRIPHRTNPLDTLDSSSTIPTLGTTSTTTKYNNNQLLKSSSIRNTKVPSNDPLLYHYDDHHHQYHPNDTTYYGYVNVKVNPLSEIHVTWVDVTKASSNNNGNVWITDVKIPLEGTSIRSLAADVRVKRQFQF